jgi:hypothetical protein
MKKIFYFSIVLLFPCFIQAQNTFWKVYPSLVEQSSKDIVATADGGYLIAGEIRTANPGDSDVYLVKTNNVGIIQWTKQYGGAFPDYPNSMVATDDGNYMVVGYTSSYGAGNNDIWLLKINTGGDIMWSKTFGGVGDDEGKEIIHLSDGNYMIVGRTNYTGGANYDGFLKKIDASGNEIWTKYYGGSAYENMRSVKQCGDGGFILIGQTLSYGNGSPGEIYLVRTNSNGDVTWAHTYGGASEDDGNFVLANADGTFTFTAETNSYGAGDMDVQAMKVDANGTQIWNRYYGGNLKDVSKTIRPTSDGGYIIAAISRSFGWINPEMWMVRINGNGDTLWTHRYGSYYHDHCYAAKQTSDGGFMVVGHQDDVNGLAHIQFVKTNANGTLDPVNVNEISSNELALNIYPNPSKGLFQVQLPNDDKRIISIGDALGNLVKEYNTASNFLTVDLSDKAKGVYFVTIHTGDGIMTKKIVVR